MKNNTVHKSSAGHLVSCILPQQHSRFRLRFPAFQKRDPIEDYTVYEFGTGRLVMAEAPPTFQILPKDPNKTRR